ncbi:MAG TPA: hypothetical protein VK616_07430, partial [Flavitalea sp.]|nr:hypothetical protein [Flavitalea sp.]
MKERFYLIRCLGLGFLFYLLGICLTSRAASENPELSIISDKVAGASVTHGLNKLTEALKAKKISFEQVTSVNDARGKMIIVTGLASGSGVAAQTLKDGSHAIPEVP